MQCTTPPVKDMRFLPPFDKYNTEAISLSSRRPIMEFIQNNEDPYTNIYKPVNLTTDDMRDDIANDVQILTFINSKGGTAYIPESYVSKVNVEAQVDFQGRGIAINLGLLPLEEPLDDLMVELTAYITGRIGILPSVRSINTSAITKIPLGDAEEFEIERSIRITSKTAVAEVVRQRETIDALKKKILDLECIIKEKVTV